MLTTQFATDVLGGLSPQEAAARLQQWGPNALRQGKSVSPLAILAGQFRSLVIWVLIGAALVSVALGEMVDGLAILAIVLLNAVIGFFQEYRAERAVAALARLAGVCAPETPLAERHNMVFLGTSVASGSGRALVVATGVQTEVGRIAALLETAQSDSTPLQRRLDQVASRLLWACLGIVVLVFVLGLLRAMPPFELFLGAVSLAVTAIPEGRGIYDNIAKTLRYLLAGNAGELSVMFVAALLGWPLPLLPIQLLWINLVTDGLPALALATDPIDPDVLTRPPRPPEAQLVDWQFLKRTAFIGCLTAGVALSAFAYEWYVDGNLADARDAAFSVLVIAELLRAFGARSNERTVWQVGLFSNLRLCGIVMASFALQLAIHHLPALQGLVGTAPITLPQCLVWLVLGAIPVTILELQKLLQRSRQTDMSVEKATVV
jgi:magnesium-transporting ATPase (P-type)